MASCRWDLDDNRLMNAKDYDINVGRGKRMYDNHDAAEGALFALVTKVSQGGLQVLAVFPSFSLSGNLEPSIYV